MHDNHSGEPQSAPSAGANEPTIRVGVVMGSDSDWPLMARAVESLEEFGVGHETQVVSAHRMPDEMFQYAESAAVRGLACLIAGAGGAAHLPGMLAAKTSLPVLGVPIPTAHLGGQDSLYSIVQMPKGVPVATFAIGESGAINAALFAVRMLATDDTRLALRLLEFSEEQRKRACQMHLPPEVL